MKKGFWSADWFVGIIVTIVILVLSGTAFLQGLERSVYDFGVKNGNRTPSDKVAVVAIDDQSIANIGRWPWSRDIHAELINILSQGGAKVIGQTVMFLDPQLDPGLAYLSEIINSFGQSSLVQQLPADLDALSVMIDAAVAEAPAPAAAPEGEPALPSAAQQLQEYYAQSSLSGAVLNDLNVLGEQLAQAEGALNTDRILAGVMQQTGNVVLAMPFVLGEPQGNPDQPLPDYVLKNSLLNVVDNVGAADQLLFPWPTVQAIPPIAELGTQALAIGHLNTIADVDGGVRSEALVLLHYDAYIPSLALQLAARSLNLGTEDIQVLLGEGVQLGRLRISTDPNLQMYTFYYGEHDGRPAFSVDSVYDILTGKIPPEKYKDKIVLIGPTAIGIGDSQVTPIGSVPPILTLAHTVSSILNEDFYVIPPWADLAKWGLFLFIAIYVIVLLPRLKAGLAAIITLVLLLTILGTQVGLLVSSAMWVQFVLSAVLLFVGHAVLTTKRFLVTEKGKEKSEAESAESNKMLGLAFQSQGQLDMAFEKFRKCPLNEEVMDSLYNLALDFERKRQFNKAGSVYMHMASFDENFKDIKERMNRSKAMEETVMLGGGGGGSATSTMLLDGGGVQKPMLGRYEVEKELGKGAMGVVYLGKDPKINRVVAIKTMALSQEFEADELDEVKERFFREAETAGRLTHPNIVTIFDAGEEHDLAYIAMEFLKGGDLVPYTKYDKLMSRKKVAELVADAADALAVAHAQNVVHRDIKPANIMYDAESDTMKITDFGIARITDSSKTKTGMVLGTPSYMSPEQLAGKKVDGRSDLFSLGVMLYQMLTGKLPFQGDSMATLMFQIANEPHPDILESIPDLPPCLKAVVDKALEKDADTRYANGNEFAKELRACLPELGD